MARKLRITASAFFAVLAIALCVLWVRSYRMGYREQALDHFVILDRDGMPELNNS